MVTEGLNFDQFGELVKEYSLRHLLTSAGYRGNLGREMEIGIRVDKLFVDDSSISIAGELLYKFAGSVARQVGGEAAEDETQFSAGLRYIF